MRAATVALLLFVVALAGKLDPNIVGKFNFKVRQDASTEFGMPCVHPIHRVVVFPMYNVATNGSWVNSSFIAFDIDTNVRLWQFCGDTNGIYCEGRVENSSNIYLATEQSIWAVDARQGTTMGQYILPANPQQNQAIPVAGPKGQLFVTFGGSVIVLNASLSVVYTAGSNSYQHIPSFYNGRFYYNNVNADGRSSLVVASNDDGSTLFQTYDNADSLVGDASLIAVASYNTNPPVVTTYSSITGKKLWETADFDDYDADSGIFVGVYPRNMSNTADRHYFLTAREMATGERLWSQLLHTAPPTTMGSGFLFTHGHANGGDLVATHINDGTIAYRFNAGAPCKAYNTVTFENLAFFGVGGPPGCDSAYMLAVQLR